MWYRDKVIARVVQNPEHLVGSENKLGFCHGNSEKDDWKDLPLRVVDESGEDDDKDGEAQEPDGELLSRGPHGLH